MKEVELRLVTELMRNTRRSDRDLAKAVGTSQPTVTRTRLKLEKEGYIKEYTIIPNFRKLGYEIMAITFVRSTKELTSGIIEKVMTAGQEIEKKTPTPTILIMAGMGFGYDGVVISFHEDYGSFMELIRMTKQLPFLDIAHVESFLISLDDKDQYRPLTFSNMARYLSKLKGKGE